MALVRRFEDLQAWCEARKLTTLAYGLTQQKGFARDFGLSDQIRRAAVSCMNNIAEGFDSGSRLELRRFLRYAARSASEVQSCLYVASDQGDVDQATFAGAYEQAQVVRRLCRAFSRSLAVAPADPRTRRPATQGRRRGEE